VTLLLKEIRDLGNEPGWQNYWNSEGYTPDYSVIRKKVDEDAIATAVQAHAPDRAVAIWKNKAERLIAQVKPSAYQEALKYLRKAGEVMSKQNKQTQWDQYLGSLREAHARKRRLIEILDGLDGKPIMEKRR